MQIISCAVGDTIELGSDIRLTVLAVYPDEIVVEVDSPRELVAEAEEPVIDAAI